MFLRQKDVTGSFPGDFDQPKKEEGRVKVMDMGIFLTQHLSHSWKLYLEHIHGPGTSPRGAASPYLNTNRQPESSDIWEWFLIRPIETETN